MRSSRLEHRFVETIPETLEEGVLYVSIEFRTTMHLCCCGCGNTVVLPLRRGAWRLTYDGETITMSPSVGNWSFGCRSHYVIREGLVVWAGDWSPKRIEAGRRSTLAERIAHPVPSGSGSSEEPSPAGISWLRRLFRRSD